MRAGRAVEEAEVHIMQWAANELFWYRQGPNDNAGRARREMLETIVARFEIYTNSNRTASPDPVPLPEPVPVEEVEEEVELDGDEVVARARRLAQDPDARFPDEDPDEPENKADGDACKFQEYIEEHQEELGSRHYVNLCDVSCQFAKLERRAARMRKKLIEYDGSDCSALVPSDDQPIAEGDYDDDESYVSDDSVQSEDHVARSSASTNTTEGGEVMKDRQEARAVAALSPSGYYMKYMDVYYAVPKPAIVRNYKRPMTVSSIDALRERVQRGARARAWQWEPIHPASVVIVDMKQRHTPSDEDQARNGKDYFWCVILKVDDPNSEIPPSDDAKILHVLPETTVARLIRTLEADETLKNSSLLNQFRPTWLDREVVPEPRQRAVPIPGPTRKRAKLPNEDGPIQVTLTGNYWPVSTRTGSKRIRSATEPIYRGRITVDDDESD